MFTVYMYCIEVASEDIGQILTDASAHQFKQISRKKA